MESFSYVAELDASTLLSQIKNMYISMLLLVVIAILSGTDPLSTCQWPFLTVVEARRFSKPGSQFLQGTKGDRLNLLYYLKGVNIWHAGACPNDSYLTPSKLRVRYAHLV